MLVGEAGTALWQPVQAWSRAPSCLSSWAPGLSLTPPTYAPKDALAWPRGTRGRVSPHVGREAASGGMGSCGGCPEVRTLLCFLF